MFGDVESGTQVYVLWGDWKTELVGECLVGGLKVGQIVESKNFEG